MSALEHRQRRWCYETVQRPVTPFPQHELLLRNKETKTWTNGGKGESILTTCPTKPGQAPL